MLGKRNPQTTIFDGDQCTWSTLGNGRSLKTRRVLRVACTGEPTSAWVTQQMVCAEHAVLV